MGFPSQAAIPISTPFPFGDGRLTGKAWGQERHLKEPRKFQEFLIHGHSREDSNCPSFSDFFSYPHHRRGNWVSGGLKQEELRQVLPVRTSSKPPPTTAR